MWNASREYEATILIKGRRPATEVVWNNTTFIEGRPGSEYELQFTNRTGNRILVIPSVDGLSVVDGKPAGINSSGFVVDPWGTVTVPGWKIDSKTAASFEFRRQGEYYDDKKTYVDALGKGGQENQGFIAFMVFREKPKTFVMMNQSVDVRPLSKGPMRSYTSNMVGSGGPICASTSLNADTDWLSQWNETSFGVADAAASEAPLGTGFGEATEFNTVHTTFERANPTQPDAVLVFRYDTMTNLKQMGVPTEYFRPKAQRPSSASGNPFPASPKVYDNGCQIPPGWNGRRRR